jgi:hypothetical protein
MNTILTQQTKDLLTKYAELSGKQFTVGVSFNDKTNKHELWPRSLGVDKVDTKIAKKALEACGFTYIANARRTYLSVNIVIFE